MTVDDENFLGRWSRRKQAERDGVDAPATEDAGDGEATEDARDGEAAAPDAGDGDDAAIDPEDLPDIDSLGKDSDFTVFMQDGVPEALRNRALRKLWTTDPVLANLDGLNDYDEDFGAIMRVGAAAMRRIAAEEARKAATVAKADDTEPGDAEADDAEPGDTEADDTEADDTEADDGGSAVADDGSGSAPESRSESAENITDSSRGTESSGADEEESAGDDPAGRA